MTPGRKPKEYDDETVYRVLRDAALGDGKLTEILRRHRVPVRTYYNWRGKFGHLDAETIRRMRAIEAECESLREELARARKEAAHLRELLGKPWRRSPPGGPPSNT
jgi:putative transposase